MTIQQKLLDYYMKCLEEMPRGSVEEADEYCREKHIEYGLCSAAQAVFNTEIYGAEWVVAATPKGRGYITKPPAWQPTIPEIETALQKRVDILKGLCE